MQRKKSNKIRGHRLPMGMPEPYTWFIDNFGSKTLNLMGERGYYIKYKNKDLFVPVFSPKHVEPLNGYHIFRKMLIRIAARQAMEETLANQVGGNQEEEHTES